MNDLLEVSWDNAFGKKIKIAFHFKKTINISLHKITVMVFHNLIRQAAS